MNNSVSKSSVTSSSIPHLDTLRWRSIGPSRGGRPGRESSARVPLEVRVDGDNINRAINQLKRKMANEGIFKELKKPEICDVLESTKRSVYKPKAIDSSAMKGQSAMMEVMARKKEALRKEKTVDDFVASFKSEYSRAPNDQEIVENLQDELSTQVIEGILQRRGEVTLTVNDGAGNSKL